MHVLHIFQGDSDAIISLDTKNYQSIGFLFSKGLNLI